MTHLRYILKIYFNNFDTFYIIIISSDIIYDDISPIPMTAPSKWRPVTAESANAGA